MLLLNPSPGPILRKADCPAGVSVGQAVSITGPIVSGSLQVDTSDPAAAPYDSAIGVVKSKPTSTTAVVQMGGVMKSLSGLTPGGTYYVGTDGGLSKPGDANFPDPVPGTKVHRQIIGIATSTDQMLVVPGTPFVPRYFRQTLVGAVDGVNTVFTTSLKFVSGTPEHEKVERNGVGQAGGVGCDYEATESVPGTGFDTITFAAAPQTSESITIDYQPY